MLFFKKMQYADTLTYNFCHGGLVTMTMDELKPGESAYIETVGGTGALRHHLLDMGLTPDAEITLQKVAPMGDPVQFEVRGYELTLRLEEARKVTVKNVHKKR